MARKTRKHRSEKKLKGIYSIPELRRSFEHIETFINEKITVKESKEQLIKDLRKEWSKVFFKDLDKKSADAFVTDRLSKTHCIRRKTAKHRGGASLINTPIAGAPLDYTTRAGIYLAPGQIPTNAGHLPLSDGSKSNFGSFTKYVDSGFDFTIPERAQPLDQFGIPGQTRFPTSVPVGMGDNTVHFIKGGSRNKSRKVRRGGAIGAILSQAFTHPISSSSPPGRLQDLQDMMYGKEVGPSPDQIQRNPQYQLGPVYPKAITF